MAGVFALAECLDDSGQVSYESSGRPTMAGLYISIAHSMGLAVAARSDKLVGVDVEPVDRQITPALRKYVLAEIEKDIFTDTETIVVWVVKEAALKLSGRGVVSPPRSLVQIEGRTQNVYRCIAEKRRLQVSTFSRFGYIIAVAYENSDQTISIH